MPRKGRKVPTTAAAFRIDPEQGAFYFCRWDRGRAMPLRPVMHGWEDVDRLHRISRGEAEEGDAEYLAALADRLKRMLPKLPPTPAHLRALRIGLGRLLGLQQRSGATRPLPVSDFAALLGISSRQASRYLAGTTVIRDEETLKRLRYLRRAADKGTTATTNWLRTFLTRPVPLRTRREQKRHGGEHLRPLRGWGRTEEPKRRLRGVPRYRGPGARRLRRVRPHREQAEGSF